MRVINKFDSLPDYPFDRLRKLLKEDSSRKIITDFSIGEPKHRIPDFVSDILGKNSSSLRKYPPNFGSEALLNSISQWLSSRFEISPPNPETDLMALNGTREGLYNATIALCKSRSKDKNPKILIPNPFYQCYLAAAIASGADPFFVKTDPETNFLPNFSSLPKSILNQTSIVFICSPSNPQGVTADLNYWKSLFDLSNQYGFKIFSDECYSEIYRSRKPIGILQAAHILNFNTERAVCFNSLSKRSNLPGLRSGFVCSHKKNIQLIKKLRSYGGAPLPTPMQEISQLAWEDEIHVQKSRQLYNQKYKIADKIFSNFDGYSSPSSGFFLWLKVGNGESFTQEIWRKHGLKCLPGSYLTFQEKGQTHEENLGFDYIRIALVHTPTETLDGLLKIAYSLKLNVEKKKEYYVNC